VTLDELKARQVAAAVEYLEVWADHVLGEAQRIVPLAEGTLAGSGDRHTDRRADGAEVTISFSTVYAARQHEELDWQHTAGRRAKYLEAPFKAALSRVEPGLAAAVRAVGR
jgi:hypothetical protein